MTKTVTDQAHSGITSLHAYEPGKPISELQRELGLSSIIKLASNENPLGMAPAARDVLATWQGDASRYPDGNGQGLKDKIAACHDIDTKRITLGNGSNDVLELVARVFLGPGKNAVFSQYAFAVYPIATRATDAEPRVVPALDADSDMPYGHDLDAFVDHIDDNTGVVFVANPNNPTGTWLSPAAIEAFLAKVPPHVVVVLDEAYVEYQDEAERVDSRALVDQYANLVVARTFSKIFGMAGLRAGYALSGTELADLLNRIRQPFNMNELAQQCAAAAITDTDFVDRSKTLNDDERARLVTALEERGMTCLPSRANFVTFDCGQASKQLFDALLHEGVIVRPLASYDMPQHVRVTVGTPEENTTFLNALDKVLATA